MSEELDAFDNTETEYETYYCYADFEFTCGEKIHRNQAELLSVGVVICDSSFEIAETYYNTICPVKNPALTSRCRRLTGLSQEDIYSSPDSDSVLGQVLDILDDYAVDEVFVWGNYDRTGLLSDAKQHKRAFFSANAVDELAEMIVDIQPEIVKKLGLPEAVNIEELAGAFGFTPDEGSFHNAFNDAMGLFEICRGAYTTDISKNKKLRKLIDERRTRREERKAEAARLRRETALALPLTDEELDFLAGFAEGEERENAEKKLLGIRYFIMKQFIALPDCERFLLICFETPRRFKVIPEEEHAAERAVTASFVKPLTREDFTEALLYAASLPDPVTA